MDQHMGNENKHNKQSLKIDPGTKKNLGMLNIIKQLQHFILYYMIRPWSILLFGAP